MLPMSCSADLPLHSYLQGTEAASSMCFSQQSLHTSAPISTSSESNGSTNDSNPNIADQSDAAFHTRKFRVHYHPAMSRGIPQEHTVWVGKEPGVHICSCLALPHTGRPCPHFYAALMNFRDIGFHISVVHPRWLIKDPEYEQPKCSTSLSKHDELPVVSANPQHAAQVSSLTKLNIAQLKEKILLKGENVRGLKFKAQFIEKIISLEHQQVEHANESITSRTEEDGKESEAVSCSESSYVVPKENEDIDVLEETGNTSSAFDLSLDLLSAYKEVLHVTSVAAVTSNTSKVCRPT